MKGYVLDIRCSGIEVAKQVEAGLRFAGSGVYEKTDNVSFRLNMNPMHVGIVAALCQNLAEGVTGSRADVKFFHDGIELPS